MEVSFARDIDRTASVFKNEGYSLRTHSAYMGSMVGSLKSFDIRKPTGFLRSTRLAMVVETAHAHLILYLPGPEERTLSSEEQRIADIMKQTCDSKKIQYTTAFVVDSNF